MSNNNVPMPTARYYPRLSEIATVDDLPEFLSFVQDGLNSIFDKIHYKNLQYSKGYRGDSFFCSLDVVTSQKLAVPLPFDLNLVLNPDLTGNDSSISSFPITLEYQWEIFAFLKTFTSESFSFSPQDFYNVGLQVFRISEEQVVAHMLNIFVEAADGITKYEQLLADLNEFYQFTNSPEYAELEFPIGVEQSIESLINVIKDHPGITETIPLVLFAVYLLRSDLDETKQRLQQFYNIVVPDGIESYIKKIITPKAKATLELNAAIEFPQNILKPVNPDGSAYTDPITNLPNPTAKSLFTFAQAQLYADTEAGIGYQLEMGGCLVPPQAMIGNTGMILELDSLKLDLSKKTNIPEADADGRANDFVGAYAKAVSVTLPSKWFKKDDSQEPQSTTLKLGAHDLLVGTGGLSGKLFLQTVPTPDPISGDFDYFKDKFDFVYPVTMFEKNSDGVVKEKEIADYPNLIAYLKQLNAVKLPYTFKYPLTLQTNSTVADPLSPSTIYIFNSEEDYQTFLSTLYDTTLWKKIGSDQKGFSVGFNKFDITFKQNSIIHSDIKGVLEIPKFQNGDQPLHIDIEGHLNDEGDFNLTASFPEGSKPEATLFNFVDFKFNSFELGKEQDDFYLGTSCEVGFQNDLMTNLLGDQKIILEKLRIYSDGNIELQGGQIPLPASISLDLGPVKMAVSHLNFGSTQINNKKYNFIGFDGAISLDPLGFDARGEGIKYYFCEDDSFLSIQTIEVDMIIPGSSSPETAMAIIHGMISIPQPGTSPEFKGDVSLKLPQAKIAGEVGMRFMPKYPAFLLDANIDLPTPIPLGAISISAFRGLLGYRYVASKTAVDGLSEDSKWYDYYKHPKRGINNTKFIGPPGSLQYDSPFSAGAGATFGTTADGGHVLSMRAMALMSLPTLFYVEAGLNIISNRLGLIENDPSNPPFFATVAFADNSLEITAGADFSIPKDSGNIFKLHALLEAGFFFKNQKPWYVNMGTRENPIDARVLTLFNAKSFIMLSAQGIEAGSRLDFKLEKKFGPAEVRLWAYMELGGKISFKRPQMGGYITAGGGVHIKIWVVSVDIALNTVFSVEAVKPFLIYAKLDLKVSAKICFVKVTKSFTVELQWEKDRKIDTRPYSPLPKGTEGDKGDNRTADAVKGVHMLTNQGFTLNYFDTVPDAAAITNRIPLDTFIDIKFNKGVSPAKNLSAKIGGVTSPPKNYFDLMPPVPKGKTGGKPIRQVRHQYAIKSIELKSWNGNSWEDYHPFEAVVEDTMEARNLVKHLPWAQWQKTTDQYDTIRVLATNPFSFLQAAEPGWHVPEQYGITPAKLFCKSKELEKEHLDFLNKNIGKRYYVPTQYETDKINGLYFKLIGDIPEVGGNKLVGGDYMSITGQSNPFGFNRSLSFRNENQLEIIFPESAIEPVLNLTTLAEDVKIKAYTAVTKDNEKFVTYEEVFLKKNTADSSSVAELTYSKDELTSAITLFDSEQSDPYLKTKIDKIVISPGSNEIAEPSATPSFTRYYGYKGKSTYSFENVLKFEDSYLISFHPQANTTALIQLDAKGKLLRERLLNGVVTSMQVIEDKLALTQAMDANQCKGIGAAMIDYDFVVGCQGHTAATAIVELDADLNQIYGMPYPNSYTLGYNKLFPIANNDKLWINTLTNETQINWIDSNSHAVAYSVTTNEIAIKVLQHNNGTTFSLITKDKKVISFSIDTDAKTISLANSVNEISDETIAEISDAVLADGKIVLAVKMSNGKSALVQMDSSNNKIVIDAAFGTGLKLSNNALASNSVLAYNNEYLFVFDSALGLSKWIKRNGGLIGASIINVQSEPSTNEILMISGKQNEKGVYFSLFDGQFNNCCLANQTAPELTPVNLTVSGLSLNFDRNNIVAGEPFKKGVRNSKLISVNDIICSNQEPEDYTTSVQQISWLTWENHLYNLSIPGEEAVAEAKQAMVDAVQQTVQPIWRPNTTYYLHFTLEDKVTSGEKSDNQPAPAQFEYYYGFKTLGPVGHYPVPDPVPAPGEEPKPSNELLDLAKSPLTSLRQYIDYDRSYPNADGNLLQSKPVFYKGGECEISLFFTQPYVYHMLKDWPQYGDRNKIKGKLNIAIKDPLSDDVITYDPATGELQTGDNPAVVDNLTGLGWTDDNDPRMPLGIKLINNFIEGVAAKGGTCNLQGGQVLKPKSQAYTATTTDLKPNKLYTVLLNNYFDDNQNNLKELSENRLVHQFGFQTSRYGNFEEQVTSYKLQEKDETGTVIHTRDALFDINLDLSQDQIDALYAVVNGDSNPLSDAVASKYQHSFDRAMEGVLKMSPLDPAQNTEFNRIIDINTGATIALLIRNPEPFNIPKMPLVEIKDTITVGDLNTETGVFTKNSEYSVLHSKDYAQVLIMNTSKNIPTGKTGFNFEYRMWNSNAEVILGAVPVTKLKQQVLLSVTL